MALAIPGYVIADVINNGFFKVDPQWNGPNIE